MNTKLIREPEERWGLEHHRAKGGPASLHSQQGFCSQRCEELTALKNCRPCRP